MNADRLHALLRFLREDFRRTRLPDRLEKLSSALQQLVQSAHPNHHQAVGNALKEALDAAEASDVNNLSPAWREMLVEIGYFDALGNAVSSKLNESFKRVGITPSIVKEELDDLSAKVTTLNNAVNSGIAAFEALSVGAEELEPRECELGFMVPKKAIDFRLDLFAAECKEFHFILSTFSEVVTGRRDDYRIRTISSSDLSVFLESPLAVAALVATAAERIVAFYKQILEIRKLRSEMLQQGVPKDALASIEEHGVPPVL